MPLINHVRGDQVPDAMLNVRTPVVKIPLWMTLTAWALRGLGRLIVAYLRFWYATVPATVLLALYVYFGWAGPITAIVVPATGLAGWRFWHVSSFQRRVWWPALSRYRRMTYLQGWHAAMVTARLAVSFDHHTVLPVLRRVRCGPIGDTLTVRMVTGQIPDDYADVAERLATTFGALGCKVSVGRKPELVTLTMRRHDALTHPLPALPIPTTPDFTALPVAICEDGATFNLRLFGTQVLIVGATGSGKGSVIWSTIRSLTGGIQSGIVQVWAFDPKGGMELGGGRPLFSRFLRTSIAAMAEALEEAASIAQARADRLCGVSRQHIPTVDDPLIVIIIDELAALTSYAPRKLRERIKEAMGPLLTQGRAVGVHVVAALQDPRKETLPDRNLFPTRIGLRLAEDSEVDMTYGKGARDRGALCDRIPLSQPGIAYVMIDNDPTPMRVRFGYVTDDDITTMAQVYGRPRPVTDETAVA